MSGTQLIWSWGENRPDTGCASRASARVTTIPQLVLDAHA
jgi:hypothetical protein